MPAVTRYPDGCKKVMGWDGTLIGVEKGNAILLMGTPGNIRRVLDALAPLLRQGPKKP